VLRCVLVDGGLYRDGGLADTVMRAKRSNCEVFVKRGGEVVWWLVGVVSGEGLCGTIVSGGGLCGKMVSGGGLRSMLVAVLRRTVVSGEKNGLRNMLVSGGGLRSI